MSEKQVEKVQDKDVSVPESRTFMGTVIPVVPDVARDFDKYIYVVTVGVRPKKSNPTKGEVFEEKKEKIDDLVQEASKTVGLEVAMSLVDKGLRRAEDFVDDGEGFIDDTVIPETRGDLQKVAAANKQEIDRLANVLGVEAGSITVDNLGELITDYLNKQKVVSANNGGAE